MGWYCKECDDWFAFGYSKKYCSEDCYDEKEERKEELFKKELSALKSSFQIKWGIEYNANSTDVPKIQKLIHQEKELKKDIEKLKSLYKNAQ